MQGCSGDTAPWDMMELPPHRGGDRRAREIGALLAGETLRLIAEAGRTLEAGAEEDGRWMAVPDSREW